MKQILVLSMVLLLCVTCGIAQSIAINTDGSTAHASAMLDIKNANKGLLIPRVALVSDSDLVTIPGPGLSLLIYNINAVLPDGAGFYYWGGSKWSKFATRTNLANLAWNTGGNAGTNGNTDFIGTTDNKPLVFKTNNILSGKIEHGSNNVFFGQSAGLNINTGINNSFFGDNAGTATTTGSGNLFAGHNAGTSIVNGNSNVFLGQGAGKNNIAGNDNVFVGEDAGFNLMGTDGTVAIGSGALYSSLNTTGSANTAVGFKALYSNNSGSLNTAVGNQALSSNISGGDNTAIGQGALLSNTVGSANTAVGQLSLAENTNGVWNTATGYQALYHNISGNANTAVGWVAMLENTSGTNNTAVGDQAMRFNTSGLDNAAFGFVALMKNTNGDKNTAFGVSALSSNVSGFQNTACGGLALAENLVGDYNSALGYLSGPAGGLTSLNNTTAVGYNARVATSNTMVFGDYYVDRWAFGITTTSAQHALEVGVSATNGNGAYLTQGGTWTNTCDVNKKEDFSSLDGNDLLQKISLLNIQRWKYKGTGEYHIGPTSQDFYNIFNVGTDDKGISTVDPAGISLAAIQELIKENKTLRAELDEIRNLLKKITGK